MPSADDPSDRFQALTPSLRALAERGVVKVFRKGQRLIDEGDNGDTLYIITRGRLRVFGSSDTGREITYGSYGAGEYIGEMSLDGGPRSASVEAIEPVECVQVTRQTLLLHIAEHPEFALELIAKVIRQARAATLSTKRLALNDAYERLVLLLNSLAVPQPDGTRLIGERLTHQEIANRLGCSREMVSRLMKDLERGGYLRASSTAIAVLRSLPVHW
jgi:CRP/FNR family transcriptional regulator, cyclic AMP receptor protein